MPPASDSWSLWSPVKWKAKHFRQTDQLKRTSDITYCSFATLEKKGQRELIALWDAAFFAYRKCINSMHSPACICVSSPLLVAHSVLPECSLHQTSSPGICAHSNRGSAVSYPLAAYGRTCTAPPACTADTQTDRQTHRHTDTQTDSYYCTF